MWTTQGNFFDQGQHASVQCFLLIVIFLNRILNFFHFFEKKVWRSWAAAQELRPHSSKSTQMCFVSWPELVCALLWWGKENQGMCEWLGGVSQKVPLVSARGRAFSICWAGRRLSDHCCGEPKENFVLKMETASCMASLISSGCLFQTTCHKNVAQVYSVFSAASII